MTSQVSNFYNKSLNQLGGSAHSARRHFLRGSVASFVVLGLLPGGVSVALLDDGAKKSTKDASSAPTSAQCDNTVARLALIHIPKTGGSSLEAAAKRKNFAWGKNNPRLKGQTVMPDGSNCSTYHVPPTLLEELNASASLEYANITTFCATRDPAERAVSEYKYLLSHAWGSKYEKNEHTGLRHFPECTKEGLNYFVKNTLTIVKNGTRYIDDCHHLPQIKYIYHKGRQVCDYVLRVENLTDSFNDLMKQFNRKLRLSDEIDRYSSSDACPDISVQDLTEDTLALLTEVYADDYRMLNYSFPSGHR